MQSLEQALRRKDGDAKIFFAPKSLRAGGLWLPELAREIAEANLKFQGGAATNTEGEQGKQGRKNRDHAYDGMAPTEKSLGFLCDSEF
jgi:hypothetical protein